MSNAVAANILVNPADVTNASAVFTYTTYKGGQSYLISPAFPQQVQPSQPKRRWTGIPKGKTKEQQDKNIRKRVSYQRFIEEARYFRRHGVPVESLPAILEYVHNQRVMYKGFSYRSNGYWARQSLELFKEDIKDYNMREQLKLN